MAGGGRSSPRWYLVSVDLYLSKGSWSPYIDGGQVTCGKGETLDLPIGGFQGPGWGPAGCSVLSPLWPDVTEQVALFTYSAGCSSMGAPVSGMVFSYGGRPIPAWRTSPVVPPSWADETGADLAQPAKGASRPGRPGGP